MARSAERASDNERKKNEETSCQEYNWSEKGEDGASKGREEVERKGGAKRMKMGGGGGRKKVVDLIHLTWAIREHIGHFV